MSSSNLSRSETGALIELFVERIPEIKKPAQRDALLKHMASIIQDLLAQPRDDDAYLMPAAYIGAMRSLDYATCAAHAKRSQDELITVARHCLDDYAHQRQGSPIRESCAMQAVTACLALFMKAYLEPAGGLQPEPQKAPASPGTISGPRKGS